MGDELAHSINYLVFWYLGLIGTLNRTPAVLKISYAIAAFGIDSLDE